MTIVCREGEAPAEPSDCGSAGASPSHASLMTCISSCKNTGYVVQDIRRALVVVPVVADEPPFDDVDFLLRLGVDDVRDQAREFDRIFLIFEQLQFERLVQPF